MRTNTGVIIEYRKYTYKIINNVVVFYVCVTYKLKVSPSRVIVAITRAK